MSPVLLFQSVEVCQNTVIPAESREAVQILRDWIPAFAGMTKKSNLRADWCSPRLTLEY